MAFKLNDYLAYIGMTKPERTVAGLARLQRAQLNTIPFENVSPLLGILPRLETRDLVEKILDNGRGGYCFELNVL